MAENPFAVPAEIQPAATGLISVEQQRAVAEVQARIYYEARGRPTYKIRRIVQHPALPQPRSAPVGANPGAL